LRDDLELVITSLAAGGDGLGRDAHGRVTFVPRTAPGDRVRARVTHATKSFARATLLAVLEPSPARIAPACEHFTAGCGGCAWQHVARDAQLAAKHAILANALRHVDALALEPIADPCPALGWRRRARFHVEHGVVGLYAEGSKRLVEIERCPQLEAELDAVRIEIASARPPDGEVCFVRGWRGEIVVGATAVWRDAARLVGRANIVGVRAGDETHGRCEIELEPEVWVGPFDFAQASAAGNAALVRCARMALGPGPGRLLELYAGSGNLTRGFLEAGWDVLATDVVAPAKACVGARFEVGACEQVLARVRGPFDAVVLDPPRTGASALVLDAIAALLPATIVYVSCDAATLARDLARLALRSYRSERAWPIDLMPQTAHLECVVRLTRVARQVA
jgi:23S rRNA (uracil1939-C5)-methyltransferase